MSRSPASVLFSCTRNVVRSPMAAAILSQISAKQGGPAIYVESVGLDPGETDPFVLEVMAEIGLDLSHHRSKTFEELDEDYFDLIVVLSREAMDFALRHTRMSATEVEYWPIPDPTLVEGNRSGILDAYRHVRDLIAQKIMRRFRYQD